MGAAGAAGFGAGAEDLGSAGFAIGSEDFGLELEEGPLLLGELDEEGRRELDDDELDLPLSPAKTVALNQLLKTRLQTFDETRDINTPLEIPASNRHTDIDMTTRGNVSF